MLFPTSSPTMNLYSSLLALLVATATTTTTVLAITVDLIHRDSPFSPLYNPSQSDADRAYNAFTRSSSRAINGFKPSQLTQTSIQPGPGDYLMNMSLGTPPFSTLVVADTGSDLVWTQCQPCSCFSQPGMPYDPEQSSTYANLPCESKSCTSSGIRAQCGNGNCGYTVMYGDDSFSSGNLAAETVTLGDTSIPNVVVGCGHANYFRSTSTGGASGIAGLGGGPLSLVSQMGPMAGGKFSYCLVPLLSSSATKRTSKLSFGPEATVSGAGTVSTPLSTRQDRPTFYYLTLEGMSVGDKRLSTAGGGSNSEGNIIIDSGTTLTFLESSMYDELVSALADVITAERVSDPTYLCYRSEGEVFEAAPVVTVHFGGGADVKLGPINTFRKVREGVACLAMRGSDDLAIYGNVAQKNFLVGYDIEGKKVSFMPTDCTQS